MAPFCLSATGRGLTHFHVAWMDLFIYYSSLDL